MRRLALRVGALSAVLAVSGAACRRAPSDVSASRGGPPRGDGVWFLDPTAIADPAANAALARLSVAVVFQPAGRVRPSGGGWSWEPAAPAPAAAPSAVPVVLVVGAAPEISAALSSEGGGDLNTLAAAIAGGLGSALAGGGATGRVAGVHLDLPFSPASAKRSGELLDALRPKLGGAFLAITAPVKAGSDESLEAWQPLVRKADALVAPVFGLEAAADAAAVDALGRPWWAAFSATARGTLDSAAQTQGRVSVAEKWLDPLSSNPRVEFENDLSVADASFAAFRLTAHGAVRLDGLALEDGDRVSYRVPALTEMLFQLGSALAGKRHALGRILVVDGAADADRLFRLAAFEDVILGRSLAPVLDAKVSAAGRAAIAVEAANPTAHASIPSRMSNWVEVDVAPAHPSDVALGGFDRYATYDAEGRPVTPGRATRVRLFETLVSPGESISPARIALRGNPPARCCRVRTHLIAASGGAEEEGDWIEPPIPPTPTKAPPVRKKK